MRRVWLRPQTGLGVSPVAGLPASGAGPGQLGGPRYISPCGLCMAPRNPRVRLGFVRAEWGWEGASRRGEERVLGVTLSWWGPHGLCTCSRRGCWASRAFPQERRPKRPGSCSALSAQW